MKSPRPSLRNVLLAIATLAAPPSIACAQEEHRAHQLYKRLEVASTDGGHSAVLDVLQGPDVSQNKSWEDHTAALQWFKDKVWGQSDPNPFYSLFYSDLLFVAAKSLDESDRPDEATAMYESSYLWLQVFECMALTDAARCNDPTATRSIAGVIGQRFSYFPPLLPRLATNPPPSSSRSIARKDFPPAHPPQPLANRG